MRRRHAAAGSTSKAWRRQHRTSARGLLLLRRLRLGMLLRGLLTLLVWWWHLTRIHPVGRHLIEAWRGMRALENLRRLRLAGLPVAAWE